MKFIVIDRVLKRLMDVTNDTTILLYQVLTLAYGILTSITALIAIFVEHRPRSGMVLLGCTAFAVILAHINAKVRKFASGIFTIIIVTNVFVLPYLFFTSGGYHSGVPLFMLMTAVSCFFWLKGKRCEIAFIVSFATDIICYVIAYKFPEYVISETDEHILWTNNVACFINVVIFISTILYIQAQLNANERARYIAQNEELEEAIKTQSNFLSNMSHEIRTPINTIIGLNEMTLRESDISDEIAENSIHIQSASKMLLAVINDILDISKIESGKMDIVESQYELSSLLSDIVNMNWVRAHDKGLEFTVEADETLPSMLCGDEIRIKQVINNLVSNAIKYTQKGSVKLSVEGQIVNLNTIAMQISVTDTGIGIKKEDIGKLFGNFTRVDEISTKGIEGTGLGLAITKQIVELMGGTVSVDSVYHQGSTFTVRFNQKIINMTAIDKIDEGYTNKQFKNQYTKRFEASSANVLVVDDNEMNLLVVKKLLRDVEVRLDTATSGEAALALTMKNTYDLIFMDHMMPNMDGEETLHGILEQPGGLNKHVPVIALTANAMSGAEEKYRKMGFAGYLAKPINGSLIESMLLKYIPEDKIEFLESDEEARSIGGVVTEQKKYKKPIVISTDSLADVPKELIEKYDIAIIPFYVETEYGIFEEGRECYADSILEHMRNGYKAKSSRPSAEQYERFFANLLVDAQKVIHISAASGQGVAYSNAVSASESFSSVTVINSGQIASGIGLIVARAAKLAADGESEQIILVEIERMKEKAHISFLIDSAEFFYYNGRIGDKVYKILERFHARPRMTIRKEKITINGMYFSERNSAIRKLIKYNFKGKENINTSTLYIMGTSISDTEKQFVTNYVNRYIEFENVYFVETSAAISINCGPGALGFVYSRV